ncbi:MAG: 2-amino-4-hydroxy-6-hydroxymethyldihydropteridine diphosphokinase [Clostridia bacterium]|nr:2-amino-4-hydroxy-6-hydroxymethyldihydropteridine diphosphokinase [Clostridia bacterium]
MAEAVIALGSNLGDRAGNLRAAVQALDALPQTAVLQCSGVYETAPVDCAPGDGDYLNAAVRLETAMPPALLLGACLGIEASQGRQRPFRNAPRTLDLDLILYEGAAQTDPWLTVPHPRAAARAFVLVPLWELYPDGAAPGFPLPAVPADAADGVRRTDLQLR